MLFSHWKNTLYHSIRTKVNSKALTSFYLLHAYLQESKVFKFKSLDLMVYIWYILILGYIKISTGILTNDSVNIKKFDQQNISSKKLLALAIANTEK